VCCSVLQCVAVCCIVLQCVAVNSTAQLTEDDISVLKCVAVCCSVLQCVAVCCCEFNGATDGRQHREAGGCAVQTFQRSPISKRRFAPGQIVCMWGEAGVLICFTHSDMLFVLHTL